MSIDEQAMRRLHAELGAALALLVPREEEREALMGAVARPACVTDIVGRLYEHWRRWPYLQEVLSSAESMDALRALQEAHLLQVASQPLVGGPELSHTQRCLRIGQAHFRSGLAPSAYMAAYGNVFAECCEEILRDGPAESRLAVRGLTTSVFYDMAAALSAYHEADRAELEAQSSLLTTLNRDLSDQVEKAQMLSKKLVASEGLASLGTMAAGATHDLATPLTCAMLSIQSARANLASEGDRSALDEALQDAELALASVSQIVEELRRVTRPTFERSACALAEVIEHVLTMAKYELPESIELKISLPESLPAIAMEADRLTRVLLNLVRNAVQAMPADRAEGNLIELSADCSAQLVSLEVGDNGVGIPPEDLGQLFAPFFSTKRDRGGSGLGLWICKDLVEACGGSLEVASTVGRGTLFRLQLPCAEQNSSNSVPAE